MQDQSGQRRALQRGPSRAYASASRRSVSYRTVPAARRAVGTAGARCAARDYCVPYRTYARTVTQAWSPPATLEYTLIAQSAADNQILAALPEEEAARLFPQLTLIEFPLGMSIYESGDVQRYIYFPADSIVSLLYVLKDGASAEIAVVGNEGAIGVALFMGGETTPSRAIVQSAGLAYRLSSRALKEEFDRHGQMLHLLLRYTQSLITQMAQTAVCNRHHSVDQQLCRWLLLSLDRLSGSA